MCERWHFDYLLESLFQALQFLLHFVYISFQLSTPIGFGVIDVFGVANVIAVVQVVEVSMRVRMMDLDMETL